MTAKAAVNYPHPYLEVTNGFDIISGLGRGAHRLKPGFANTEHREEVGRQMKWKTVPICLCLLLIAGLPVPSFAAPQASAAPQLSGSYKIIQKSEKNGETQIHAQRVQTQQAQVQVQLQLHLVNRSFRDLHIQHITLWDFAHPSKGGSQACSLVVHSAASISTTQQFTVPRAELDLWKRGTRPRVVLELATPNGRPSTAVVRLDRASGGKEY